jgi:hypothetical protein
MTQFESVQSYAEFVQTECPNMLPINFFRRCNEMFLHIDSLKMIEMLEMINRQGEFFISGKKLGEYDVMTIRDSSHILQMLRSRNLKDGKDYLSPNVRGNLLQTGRPATEYLLTPRAFKHCLMGSKKNSIYRDYYIMLEECVYYYDRIAQHKLMNENRMLIAGNERLEHEMIQSRLQREREIEDAYTQREREIEDSRIQRKHAEESARIHREHLERQLREIRQENEVTRQENATAHEEIRDQLSVINASIKRIVNKERNPSRLSHLCIFQREPNNDELIITTGLAKSIDARIRKERREYPDLIVWIRIETPNALRLWDAIVDANDQLDIVRISDKKGKRIACENIREFVDMVHQVRWEPTDE